MKAAILDKYDKNGTTLAVRDVPTPKPAAHEVLVRIHTAAVNPLDNMIIRGDVRLIVPYRTPLVMGNEFSGTVVQAGTAAGKFKSGDRVYGRMPLAKIGAFAEYAAIDEGALALVPSCLSMEEAACSEARPGSCSRRLSCSGRSRPPRRTSMPTRSPSWAATRRGYGAAASASRRASGLRSRRPRTSRRERRALPCPPGMARPGRRPRSR